MKILDPDYYIKTGILFKFAKTGGQNTAFAF